MNLISHRLKILREAGLVDVERDATDARGIYYPVNRRAIAQLREQLDAFLNSKRILPRQPSCGPRLISEPVPVTRR